MNIKMLKALSLAGLCLVSSFTSTERSSHDNSYIKTAKIVAAGGAALFLAYVAVIWYKNKGAINRTELSPVMVHASNMVKKSAQPAHKVAGPVSDFNKTNVVPECFDKAKLTQMGEGAVQFDKTMYKVSTCHIIGYDVIVATDPANGKATKSVGGGHYLYSKKMAANLNVPLQFVKRKHTQCGALQGHMVVDGVKSSKVWFPAEWGPEKILEKINESVNWGFEKSESGKYGCTTVTGYTTEGLRIITVLRKNDNTVVSAYPDGNVIFSEREKNNIHVFRGDGIPNYAYTA